MNVYKGQTALKLRKAEDSQFIFFQAQSYAVSVKSFTNNLYEQWFKRSVSKVLQVICKYSCLNGQREKVHR